MTCQRLAYPYAILTLSLVLGLTALPLDASAEESAAPPTAPPDPPPAPPFPSPTTPGGGTVGAPAAPSVASTPPVTETGKPLAACMRDIECKGDRICVRGECVSPNAGTTREVMISPKLEEKPQMVILYTPPKEEGAAPSGITFGARFGVGFPNGAAEAAYTDPAMGASSTGLLSDAVGVLLPVTLDLSYRVNPHWNVGVYLAIGYGTGSNCASSGTDGATCYETDYRFGFDVQYTLFPKATLEPWLGLGAGWEVLNSIATDDAGDEESGSVNGVEIAHLDVGVDYRINERQRAGLFFQSTFGDFLNAPTPFNAVKSVYIHEWFTIGMRWRFDTDWWKRGG